MDRQERERRKAIKELKRNNEPVTEQNIRIQIKVNRAEREI